MALVILKVLIKELNLLMKMLLKQEVMKYQNLHSRKKLELKMSDVQIFTPICSASTNFLSNYAPQFLFRLITVSVIFHVFTLLIILINFEKKYPLLPRMNTLCFLFRSNLYKGIFLYCSINKNLKLFRRSHLQKLRKTLVVIKISKNLQKLKYIAITDVKKLILILLECFNSVLLKNEHFDRYLEKKFV